MAPKKRNRRPAGEDTPDPAPGRAEAHDGESEKTEELVLLDTLPGLGRQGAVVTVPAGDAAALKGDGLARPASERDLRLAKS